MLYAWDCLHTTFARHTHTVQSPITHCCCCCCCCPPPHPPPHCYRCCTTQSQAAQAFQMNAAEDMPESRPAAAAGGLVGTQPDTQGPCLASRTGPAAFFSSCSLNHQAVVQGVSLQHSGIGSAAPATTHACTHLQCLPLLCDTRTPRPPSVSVAPALTSGPTSCPPSLPCPPNPCTHLTHISHS